jgi:hypothetical protein
MFNVQGMRLHSMVAMYGIAKYGEKPVINARN